MANSKFSSIEIDISNGDVFNIEYTHQSDWDELDELALNFIKNKPSKLSDFQDDIGVATNANLTILDAKIDDEITRATNVDTNLLNKIDNEITRAIISEQLLNNNLNSEISRATNYELNIVHNLDLHTTNKNNPHVVTKLQLGLENVNNTTDLNKPISYATQEALNLKADSSDIPDSLSDLLDDSTHRLVTDTEKTTWNSKLDSFTETDPIFISSQAHNITSTHISVLNNTSGSNTGDETSSTIKTKLGISTLSGSNTGDQDLSSYALITNIPTKTSELTNDSNFVIDTSYVHTDNNFTSTLKSNYDIAYTNSHSHMNKSIIDKFSYDTVLKYDGTAVGAVLSVNTQTGNVTLDIPDSLSDLLDDSTHRLVTDTEKTTWNSKQNNLGYTPEDINNKNANNGYCSLDSGGKVPFVNLPSTLLKYIGVWDALANTPTLTNPDTTKKGYVYNVGTAGSQFDITFSLGDWLIYNDNGEVEKSDNSDDVVSVNGQTGTVVITKSSVGLSNVDNTRDANKPISIATQTELDLKANLSTTYTKTESNGTFEYKLPSTPINPESKFLNANKEWSEVSIGSGGYSANIYFTNIDSEVVGYKKISYELPVTPVEISADVTNEEILAYTFLYDSDISISVIDAGLWVFNYYTKVSSLDGDTRLKASVFLRHIDNSETELFNTYSSVLESISYSTLRTEYNSSAFNCSSTDRLGVKVYASTTSQNSITITSIIGDGNASYFTTPLRLRHSQLRDLNSDDNYLHVTNTEKTTWDNKQDALGYTPENSINKENSVLDTSTIKYPTNNLVKGKLDLKADTSSLDNYVLKTTTINLKGLSSNIILTTADISDTTNKRYCTDDEKTKLYNTSGSNTGDETSSTIKTKLGISTLSGSNTGDQDLSSYALITNIPTKTSELTNDSNFVISSDIPDSLSDLLDDSTHRLVTDTEKTTWNSKLDSFTETDPIFISSQAHNITSTHISVLNNTSGSNTGDETSSTIKTKLGISTLSGSNTGDETSSTIKTKLGISTLSGIIKGDGSGNLSAAIGGTDYLTPSGSGANLTSLNASNISSGTISSSSLPVASTSVLGGVKVDGSTITITNGIISSSGGSPNISTITSDTTLTDTSGTCVYLVNSTDSVKITLPTAVNNSSTFIIKKIFSNNVVILQTNSNIEYIDGDISLSIVDYGDSITLISDNSNWWMI